jgi:acetyl-CoA carboxylase beta subunit
MSTNAENGFDFLERCYKDGDEFLNHIVRVTVETKEQSKQWMHTNSYKTQAENFKQTLSACQKVDGICFLGQKMSAESRVHATRDHNNIRSLFRNKMKSA